MLMSCAIALSGSELAGGCFVAHRGVLLPSVPQPPVSESAVIDFPIAVKPGVTVGDGVVVCGECRVGCGSILRPRSFLSKRVRVGKGCVVTGGSVVPAGTIIPTGFTYRSTTVELCRELPQLITRPRTGFVRRECGFVDLRRVLGVCPELLWEYVGLMWPFPKELGRQLGTNCDRDLGLDAARLFDVFRTRGLSVSLEFWSAKGGESAMANVFRELARMAVGGLEEFMEACDSQENFEFLLYLSLNLKVLEENQVGDVPTVKKRLFEFADEQLIRMGLMRTPEATRGLPVLERLLEVTHFQHPDPADC
jgi:hypothetical protein